MNSDIRGRKALVTGGTKGRKCDRRLLQQAGMLSRPRCALMTSG